MNLGGLFVWLPSVGLRSSGQSRQGRQDIQEGKRDISLVIVNGSQKL